MAGGRSPQMQVLLEAFSGLIRATAGISALLAHRCRAASKAASQARWVAKPENQDYFQGPVHLARGQAWRARHPGYWRNPSRVPTALKDVSMTQPVGSIAKTGVFVRSPLQDLLTAQPAVLIGLIAHLVGTPLQEDMVRTTDRLLRLGQDILAMSGRPAPAPP